MAIKVEVVTPTATVAETPGESTIITVVRSTSSPIVTNGNAAVVEVVGKNIVTGVVVQQAQPTIPHEGMVWAGW